MFLIYCLCLPALQTPLFCDKQYDQHQVGPQRWEDKKQTFLMTQIMNNRCWNNVHSHMLLSNVQQLYCNQLQQRTYRWSISIAGYIRNRYCFQSGWRWGPKQDGMVDHENGQVVDRDDAKATALYQKVIDNDHFPVWPKNLQGRGVEKDQKLLIIIKWLLMMAMRMLNTYSGCATHKEMG